MDLMHPEHPYEPIEHEVTIGTHAIRRYCHPVSFRGRMRRMWPRCWGFRGGCCGARKQGQF
jgi:hypothetical protein